MHHAACPAIQGKKDSVALAASLLKNFKVCSHQNTLNKERPNSVNSMALGVGPHGTDISQAYHVEAAV